MRVLVVAAHPDDEVLGCGGTLAKHAMAGDDVHVHILGRGRNPWQRDAAFGAARALGINAPVFSVLPLTDQRFDMVPRLDIVQNIERVVGGLAPGIVYTHHVGDRNLDHRVVADAVLTACRPLPGLGVEHLLSFEVQSSTEWGAGFVPNTFVALDPDAMARKNAALDCYGLEMPASPHARSRVAISARMCWLGASVGFEAAEGFMLVREIIP